MPENIKTGSCLCNSVGYKANVQSMNAHVCHCGICRKNLGGSPTITVNCSYDSLRIENDANLEWYKSSEWAERGFCKLCGTSLFSRAPKHQYLGVSVGTLNDQSDIKITEHIFIDMKPDYYDFKDDCPRLTEEEFLKSIASGEA